MSLLSAAFYKDTFNIKTKKQAIDAPRPPTRKSKLRKSILKLSHKSRKNQEI